jgi:hypothetical protein
MDPKGKGMAINDKDKETLYIDEPKGDKPSDSGSSHKKRDGKKKRHINKIIYYDNNVSSSSPRDDDDEDSSSKNKTVNQNYYFDYSRIPYNSNAHLLSIPLRKPPHFDGEDYSFWSHKMHSHLFSLHPSIWGIVENGMHFDSTDNPIFINEQIHKNVQATTVLLASLCRDEYNKVSGSDNAKQIWDTLKISHEATMITKMELVEDELGIFTMIRGEEPTQTYNRLKVNQVRNLRSTKWDDHEMVKVILRSLVFRNPTQVQLICRDPRYKQMSPEEVIGKFVSFELMSKDSKHIVNLEQGAASTPEVQPVAFKAMEEKKEESTPTSRIPINASKLDNEEMALIIKSFRQILKQRKGKDYKPLSKRVCYRCGKSGHFIAKCPYTSDSDRDDDKKGKKKIEKKRYYHKKGGEAHMGQEWDSDESSIDSSSDEDAANIVVNKGLLFPNVGHKCLMAK